MVGGQNLIISGDKVKIDVDVTTNIGIKTSIQDFLILENDEESLVMGVQWNTSLVGEKPCGEFGKNGKYRYKLSNPLESTEDKPGTDE